MHEVLAEAAPRPPLAWLFLRRQRRALTLAVPSAAAAAERARTAPPGDRLRVRLHHGGRLVCRPRQPGRTRPPYFTGELRDGATGGELTGTIHESPDQVVVTTLFGALAVFMAAVAVACALASPVVVPGLVICGIAAVAFAALSFALRALRPMVFRVGTIRLTQQLAQRFGAIPPTGPQ